MRVWRAEAGRLVQLLKEQPAIPPTFEAELIERQAAVLLPWLDTVMAAGLAAGAGRKAEPPELEINWELVNQQAADWAEQYGYSLVRQITETTMSQLQAQVNQWIEVGETFPQLVNRVNGIFNNPRRAALIAATEATRAYAEANTIAWQDIGAWGREWRTAVDELVCPTCRPLHQTRAAMGQGFGNVLNPPAHPGCRCSLVPVVEPEVAPSQIRAGEAVRQQLKTVQTEWQNELERLGTVKQDIMRAADVLSREAEEFNQLINRLNEVDAEILKLQKDLLPRLRQVLYVDETAQIKPNFKFEIGRASCRERV